MRRLSSFFWLLAFPALPLSAQYGNEWIKFNQQYYKIPVAADGLYRITYAQLQASGFAVDAADPRRLQLFHRGVEQAIYVQGQADAKFDPSDFIEFYGQRNDGTLDTEMYEPPSAQPHPYLNLYSDTTAYFLTENVSAVLGKRMSLFSEVNTGGLPPQSYQNAVDLKVNGEMYAPGVAINDYIYNTFFDQGEGWTGTEIREGQKATYTFTNITGTVPAQGTPTLEVMLVGLHSVQHSADIYVGPTAGSVRQLVTLNFSNYNTVTATQSLNWTDIGADGMLVVEVRGIGTGGTERISTCYLRLTFPQDYNATGVTQKYLALAPNAGGKSYLEITNAPSGLRLFDVTDPSNVRRIGTVAGTPLKAVVDNVLQGRRLLAASTVLDPAIIKKTDFRMIDPASHDYVIISSRSLMKPAGGFPDVVRAYAGYRSSAAGGSYDTLVVDMDQLYNQFSYGETTPVSILHFVRYLTDVHLPKYLFLIGKGLEVGYNYHRNPPAFTTYADLVPTMGHPSSDIYFSAGLNGTTYEPAIPTGRLSVMTPQEVANYLNKVKEMEAAPYQQDWRKQLLHLSGGINPGEPQRFRQFLEAYASIAEGYYLGGNVKAIAKQSTDIDFINIKNEVNDGLNLITFFGHSSPSTIDFDIGFVTDPKLGFANKGKYPVLLMNGCNIGSFFLNTKLFGEDWINAKDKGAVGFIAHSSYGLEYTLNYYATLFYQVGYGDATFISKGLGDIQKEVARRYLADAAASTPNITQVQQMVLLGDPAVKLFGANKPDYAMDDQSLYIESFDNNPVSALSDSIALRIVVKNFGIGDYDPVIVRVVRTVGGGNGQTTERTFNSVLNADTLLYTIYNSAEASYGINTFEVAIDPDDSVAELKEDNNTATLEYFIPLNRPKTLFPTGYGIVTSTTPTMRFQTTDLLSAARDFRVELDTTDHFNSPFRKVKTVNARVLGSVQFSLLNKDSTAYYWRTRFSIPGDGESAEWVTSTFTYIADGSPGWAQVSFPQFAADALEGLVPEEASRQWHFMETVTSLSIHTFGSDNPALNTDVSVKIDDAEYNLSTQNQPCRDNTINLIAFDKTTTVPYYGDLPFNFQDPRTCGREPQVIVSFTPSEIETGMGDDLFRYIDNLAAGDSVVLFSIGDAGFSVWSAAVVSKLGEIGISSSQVAGLTDGEPLVVLAKKGSAPGSALFFTTADMPATGQELLVDATITGRYTSGTIQSVTIGPATAWGELYGSASISELPLTDEYRFDVNGVADNVTLPMALGAIDAEETPVLNLTFNAVDETNLTPPQLRHWIVTYTPASEGLLLFEGDTTQQTVQEGEPWSEQYGFVNISDQSFPDSLDVALTLFNNDSKNTFRDSIKIAAPAPGDTTWFDVEIKTTGRAGTHDLTVFVNPHTHTELYYDNNILTLARHLKILPDKSSPVLDVTFDGRHLVDGDYVSPNPEIVVSVWDENPFLLKTDTTGIHMYMRTVCDTCTFEEIWFGRGDVTWSPATSAQPFRAVFLPADLADGTYQFEAEAGDASGNASGGEPYAITFSIRRVVAATLTPPYPNPSSGEFHFDLRISGDDRPDYVKLEITTLTGLLLNSFATENLHVGQNRLVWDGLDLYGKPVDSGLYVYHLIVVKSGQQLAVTAPEGGGVLRNGYGKLLVAR